MRANDEVAAALTLTGRGRRAARRPGPRLQHLPLTFAALAAGQIDCPGPSVCSPAWAARTPTWPAPLKPRSSTGPRRRPPASCAPPLNQALLAADPPPPRRRQDEEKHARIEQLPEPGGLTGTLAWRLPVTATVAAWNRISALARQLQAAGVQAPSTSSGSTFTWPS